MEDMQNIRSKLLNTPGLEEVRKTLREKILITPQVSEEMSQTVRRQEALVDSLLRAYTMYDNGIPMRPTLGNEMQIMYMRERQTLSFLLFPELLKLEYEVARVIGADRRIGPKFLKAGPGFGGSCFKKDVLNLVYLCETFGLHTAAEYWNGVIQMNEHQQQRIVSRLFREMFNTLANKRIAMFGFAFKADTGDTRETPAGTVARLLADEHVRLVITDPKALGNARLDLADLKGIEFEEDEYRAARAADAILLMTDWKRYPQLDWARLYKAMRKPALVFDTRNCLDADALRKIGFKVLNIGK